MLKMKIDENMKKIDEMNELKGLNRIEQALKRYETFFRMNGCGSRNIGTFRDHELKYLSSHYDGQERILKALQAGFAIGYKRRMKEEAEKRKAERSKQ